MGFLQVFYGFSMGFLWVFYGFSTGFLWVFYRFSTGLLYVYAFVTNFMGFPFFLFVSLPFLRCFYSFLWFSKVFLCLFPRFFDVLFRFPKVFFC